MWAHDKCNTFEENKQKFLLFFSMKPAHPKYFISKNWNLLLKLHATSNLAAILNTSFKALKSSGSKRDSTFALSILSSIISSIETPRAEPLQQNLNDVDKKSSNLYYISDKSQVFLQ